jgi:hypothetical protein
MSMPGLSGTPLMLLLRDNITYLLVSSRNQSIERSSNNKAVILFFFSTLRHIRVKLDSQPLVLRPFHC